MCYLERHTELWVEKILMGTNKLNGLSARFCLNTLRPIYGAELATQGCPLLLKSKAFM